MRAQRGAMQRGARADGKPPVATARAAPPHRPPRLSTPPAARPRSHPDSTWYPLLAPLPSTRHPPCHSLRLQHATDPPPTTTTTTNPPLPWAGKLDLRLLPHALTPWTDALSLTGLEGVDDAWLARAAVCSGLRVLDITNCNLVGRGAGGCRGCQG